MQTSILLRMAKAQIKTPEGLVVNVDGTPDEIVAVVKDLKSRASGPPSKKETKKKSPRVGSTAHLITNLSEGTYFGQPRRMAAIRDALAEIGHHYPLTAISPVMLQLVRQKTLRRMKENNRWAYVKGPNFP
jgi:hypothetical protein